MIKIKDLQKVLREKTTISLDEEREKNEKLDRRLFESEIVDFEYAVKVLKTKPGRPSKSLSKLEDMIRDYRTIMDVDKKIRHLRKIYFQYLDKEMERIFF